MLKNLIAFHFKISSIFLVLAVFFGWLYSMQLLGALTPLFDPTVARSLHISLMLYGFPSLMLSMLPFALFDKDGLESKSGLHYLNLYFIFWYIFLIFMVAALLLGNTRGLPFYDFPYELNFILAASGIFYFISILKYIKHYSVKPLWVKISLVAVAVAPFLLILLMNPDYGQVEQMELGPHGDNTLGMSFALLVLYFLAIKLASPIEFKARFHILWMIPLGFYISSVVYRSFIGNLSYEAEWFLQWLSLLYVPILYFWFKDAQVSVKENLFLYISILAFLFVDIQGNILFIPELREAFHRNDLVVGHAHIAVGISMLFLSFAIVKNYFKISNRSIWIWTSIISLMSLALSINGFYQAGYIEVRSELMWQLRSFFGALFLIVLLWFYFSGIRLANISKLRWYHLLGFLSDGIGGLTLLFFGPFLYGFLQVDFAEGYQMIVFGFMSSVGLIHLLGFIYKEYEDMSAYATIAARVITSALFFAMFKADIIGWIALVVGAYDLVYALIYILFLKEKNEIFNR